MVQAQLIKYGIILAVLVALIGGVWLKIASLNSKLYACAMDVRDLTSKLTSANLMLERTTEDKNALASSITKANAQRAQVQAQLNTTLSKLRQQKPPSECKAAIDWAVENKEDLSWSK